MCVLLNICAPAHVIPCCNQVCFADENKLTEILKWFFVCWLGSSNSAPTENGLPFFVLFCFFMFSGTLLASVIVVCTLRCVVLMSIRGFYVRSSALPSTSQRTVGRGAPPHWSVVVWETYSCWHWMAPLLGLWGHREASWDEVHWYYGSQCQKH